MKKEPQGTIYTVAMCKYIFRRFARGDEDFHVQGDGVLNRTGQNFHYHIQGWGQYEVNSFSANKMHLFEHPNRNNGVIAVPLG